MPLVLLALLAAAPTPGPSGWWVPPVRAWLSGPRGPMHVEDPAAPLPGASELAAGSPGHQEVVGLVSRGCALSGEAAPRVPRGRLWELDLDGDGTPERVFIGGCSPEPYHLVLKSTASGWVVWREGPGWLLEVQRHGAALTLVSARDGYGIERESELRLETVDQAGVVLEELAFRVVGEQPPSSAPATGATCLLRQRALLRFEPRVQDAPEESGMGFDYPGNVLQALARGSEGLALGSREGWRLCAFAAPPRPGPDRMRTGMLTPVRSTLAPGTRVLLVGWLPAASLQGTR